MKPRTRLKRRMLRVSRRNKIEMETYPTENYLHRVVLVREDYFVDRRDTYGPKVQAKEMREYVQWEVDHGLSQCCGKGLDEYGNLIFPYLKDHAEPDAEPFGDPRYISVFDRK